MTATEASRDVTAAAETGNGDRPSPEDDERTVRPSRRTVERLALAVTLAPFAVSALALLFAVGGQYHPVSDHALTELQTRSVGRDEVLVGLYSRDEWNHPGPALFYLLAPFYRLTGGMSVGINLGALAVNAAAVTGMALVARRLGGTRLMLVTLMASALLMRMLSAEFLYDPWNCYVTALPYGLLIMLTWAMWRGETWAFPVAAAVTTFLAQSHVGFVPLAAPLLAWGAVGLVASVVRRHDDPDPDAPVARRRLVRSGLVGAGVLAVAWLPPVIDALRHRPPNAVEIVRYFRDPGEEAASLAAGWRVMTGQLGGLPEWLTYKRTPVVGESPFIASAPFPWLLVLLVVAGVVLWRRAAAGGRSLLVTLALTYAVGIVSISRTVGGAFDYRLRWTYLPAMVAFVVVGWAVWTLAAERWPRRGGKVLTGMALTGLTLLAGVNVVTAATAGTPQNDDSAAVASLSDQVLEYLPDDAGTVLVTDALHSGAWHGRGIVLQLERQGIDVVAEADRADQYGRHRVTDDPGAADVRLVVTRDQWVDQIGEQPGMRLIAEWYAIPRDEADGLVAEAARIDDDLAAGRVTWDEVSERRAEIADELTNGSRSLAWRAAVFVDEGVGAPAG